MSSELSLPALAPTRSSGSSSSSKPQQDDHSVAVNAMCKKMTATVTQLLFSFQALQAEADARDADAKTSISLALAASKREELSTKIVEALSGAVEKVVRCKDVSLRSSVVRDLRARFAPPPEKPKPEMIDEAVQAVVRKPRVSLAAAAAAAAATTPSPPVRVAAPAEEGGPSDEDLLRQLRGEGSPPSTADAGTGASTPPASSAAAGAKPRPVSAAGDVGKENGKPSLPGIYERQMQWAAKAAGRKEALRVEKENREREAEKAPRNEGKASSRWGHVQSVMKKERLAEQETWKEGMQEQMAAEQSRRERAEQRARDEAEARAKIAAEKEEAVRKRQHAEEKMNQYHQRAVKAEGECKEARQAASELEKVHAEALEIRDAFGERGLEQWPMFPGKKVHRVLGGDEFDGRVSQEFRVKDSESGERGVTLLMGRLAGSTTSEAQAVLFDVTYLNDLDAARWFARNAHRFDAVRERVAREKQRASTAIGRSRGRPELS